MLPKVLDHHLRKNKNCMFNWLNMLFLSVLFWDGVRTVVGGADLDLVPISGEEVVIRGTGSLRILLPCCSLGSASCCNHHHLGPQAGWESLGKLDRILGLSFNSTWVAIFRGDSLQVAQCYKLLIDSVYPESQFSQCLIQPVSQYREVMICMK